MNAFKQRGSKTPGHPETSRRQGSNSPLVQYLDMWEPAMLEIKEGYNIKFNGPRGVVMIEKFTPTAESLTEKQGRIAGSQGREEHVLGNHNSREKKMQAIEESFKAAISPLIHQSNRSLKPVEIFPLLPDFDL